MLIAPKTRLLEGDAPQPFTKKQRTYKTAPLPEYTPDTDLKLSEGHSVVYVRAYSDTCIEVVDTFLLDYFLVKNNKAHWIFKSDKGVIADGSIHSVILTSRLSVKLVTPIVLLPNKGTLKTTFRFRLDPEYRIFSKPTFNALLRQGG